MKKLILIIMLLIPMFVYATDDCNSEDIIIEKIDYVRVDGKTVELSEPKVDGQKINFDIKFSKLNDSIEYKLLLKNNSNEDYQIDENSISYDNDNVSFILDYGESSVLGVKEEKEVSLIIKYDKKVDDSLFKDNEFKVDKELTFSLIKNQQDNPLTKNGIFVVIVLILSLILMVVIYINFKKISSIGIFILLIPIIVSAVCNVKIKVNSHFVIERYPIKKCYFDGDLVKGAEYEDDLYVYRYLQESYYAGWSDIDEGWGVRLKDTSSTDPVIEGFCTYINDIPVTSIRYLFANSKTMKIDLTDFNTSNVKTMQQVFYKIKVDDLDFSNFDTSNATTMKSMFAYLDTNELDLTGLDTSNVSDMSTMFAETNIDFVNMSGIDTSNVTTMYDMFDEAKIGKLNISNLSNEKVTNMERFISRFEGEVDFTNFKTPSVTTMELMFAESTIPHLDLSSFDTKNVITFKEMFFSFDGEEDLDLSNFNTINATSIHTMFCGSKFKTIDLSSFDTRNVTEMNGFILNCPNLTTVYASDNFVHDAVVGEGDVIFNQTPKLVGGQGTVCNNIMTNPRYLYARIDGGPSAPGCFTLKG